MYTYMIEDHYEVVDPTPIEYSSIEDLKRLIADKVAEADEQNDNDNYVDRIKIGETEFDLSGIRGAAIITADEWFETYKV